jgi:hypothetical protein
MELFNYLPDHRLWICQSCRYAVSPSHTISHLENKHRQHAAAKTLPQRQEALKEMLKRLWFNNAKETVHFPPPSSLPVPGLPIYKGHGCPSCSFVAPSMEAVQSHSRKRHPDVLRNPRGQPSPSRPHVRRPQYWAVNCQRFFASGPGSSYFMVILPTPYSPSQPI